MAAKTTTVNQQVELDTNRLNSQLDGLEDRLQSLFSIRWKNDPKKAAAEAEKYQKKMLSSEKQLKNVERALDKDAAKKRRQEDIQARKDEAKLQLATADNFKDRIKATGAALKASLSEAGDNLKESLKGLGSALGAAVDKGIDEYASTIAKYSAQIEARLQTGAKDDRKLFDNLLNKVKSTLSVSPYLKQETMLENLNELIQLGVNYNIEQRAFLQSMTDKIVTTFNAFDSNLLNLIRLQQADSTAARMGMEASLTKSFNDMFKDTSYLSGAYDQVSQALLETISMMTKEQGLEFEYVVQKWLGSLGSVGFSDAALTKIATAINQLGTGNITALAGDSAMLNLLTRASNIQGLNITDLLTNGFTPDKANRLFRGIADYVVEISSTENHVVRQQFGELFGMSMADLRAAINLNTDALNTVQSAMLTYKEAVNETQSQLYLVKDRMHISEMVNTLFENVMATTAGNIANNTATYMLWKTLNVIEKLTGGIQIPAFSVMGNMVDLDTTVTALMKNGMAGLSLISTLVGAIGNLSNGGSLNLNNWGAEEVLTRGTGFGGVKAGYTVTQSNSAVIASSSGSDMADQAITAASEEGNEKIASAQSEETATERMLKAIMIAVTGSDDPEAGARGVRVALASDIPVNVRVTNTQIDPVITSSFAF